jgi:hypothetical protein
MMVNGTIQELNKNDHIDIVAIFHKEGYLELKEFHVRKFRRSKIFLSILPILFVTWLFFRRYRFDKAKGIFVEI